MFWTNFEYLCRQAGKSPSFVAAEVGVRSSGSVTAWKVKGALPRQSTLEGIAEYFGVSSEELISADLRERNNPILNENEVRNFVAVTLEGLTPEEVALVNAYAAGLKAARKP